MNIGNRIKQLRENKKMIQKDLAKKAGLSGSYVCELERAESCQTSTLELLCNSLGYSLAEFFSDESLNNESDYKLLGIIKEIGLDYLVFAKELKDQNISPDELRKTLNSLKALGLLKN